METVAKSLLMRYSDLQIEELIKILLKETSKQVRHFGLEGEREVMKKVSEKLIETKRVQYARGKESSVESNKVIVYVYTGRTKKYTVKKMKSIVSSCTENEECIKVINKKIVPDILIDDEKVFEFGVAPNFSFGKSTETFDTQTPEEKLKDLVKEALIEFSASSDMSFSVTK